jgi:hypothetical protein
LHEFQPKDLGGWLAYCVCGMLQDEDTG